MTANAQRSDGQKIFRYFLLFFLAVGAVDATMATLAIKTHSGLVTDHAYEKGLAYNQVIAAKQAQDALGWHGTMNFDNDTLSFALTDKSGKALTPDSVVATITRPTESDMDETLTLQNSTAKLNLPASGVWDIRITATLNGTHFQQAKRIVVP